MNYKRFQTVKQVVESSRVARKDGRKLVTQGGVKFILPKADKS